MRTTEGAGPDPALGEYTAMGSVALSDAERWPTLDADGLARVDAWRDRPGAPVWVHATGDRLDGADLAALELARARLTDQPGEPTWVSELVVRVHATVPRWRRAARTSRTRRRTSRSTCPWTGSWRAAARATRVPR